MFEEAIQKKQVINKLAEKKHLFDLMIFINLIAQFVLK